MTKSNIHSVFALYLESTKVWDQEEVQIPGGVASERPSGVKICQIKTCGSIGPLSIGKQKEKKQFGIHHLSEETSHSSDAKILAEIQ